MAVVDVRITADSEQSAMSYAEQYYDGTAIACRRDEHRPQWLDRWCVTLRLDDVGDDDTT